MIDKGDSWAKVGEGAKVTAYVRIDHADGRKTVFSFDEFYVVGRSAEAGRLESFVQCDLTDLLAGVDGVIGLIGECRQELSAYSFSAVMKGLSEIEYTINQLKG